MSPRTVRGLVRAWSAGLVLLILLPAGAALWERLDRRPAWVAAVFIHVRARSAEGARQAERLATAAVARDAARARLPRAEPRRLVESSQGDSGGAPGDRTDYTAGRTTVLRADTERQLLDVERAINRIDGVTSSVPRRALRLSDLSFGFVLLALLLGFATLERPGLVDADPFAQQPPLVVLDALALGSLAAGAAITGVQGPRLPLEVCVLLACVPPVVWLVRTRVPWRTPPLSPRWTVTALATGLVAALWLLRFAQG